MTYFETFKGSRSGSHFQKSVKSWDQAYTSHLKQMSGQKTTANYRPLNRKIKVKTQRFIRRTAFQNRLVQNNLFGYLKSKSYKVKTKSESRCRFKRESSSRRSSLKTSAISLPIQKLERSLILQINFTLKD